MKVIAFIGPSGTGKSYKALNVAKQKGIDYIIDDGLLIGNSKVLAGISAKKESSKIAAIRRACFFDANHVAEVKQAVEKYNPKSIMVIATSDAMAETIRNALGLEEISEKVYINEVSSENEINKALQSRESEGKHVIPVPTFELQKTFSGYFMDALKVLTKKGDVHEVTEKTIVRPVYSYLGKYVIADTVIKDIVKFLLSKEESISKVTGMDITNCEGDVCVTVYVVVNYQMFSKDIFPRLQYIIKDEIERLTCMNVVESNIVLKSLKV